MNGSRHFFAAIGLLTRTAVASIVMLTPAVESLVAVAQTATMPAATGDQSPANATAPAPAIAMEVVENPYGLDSLWRQGDYVARGTLVLLLIMSMASWYVIGTKLAEQHRLMRQAEAATNALAPAGSVPDEAKRSEGGNAFRFISERGAQAVEDHKRIADQVDLHTWVTIAIQRAMEAVQSRLQGGLALLATVGSTAPFVGLFGTVWGIYHALTAIGIAGQASIDKVAGPVGEALIMTAFGLAVAVPAVLGYNWLVRRNKVAMEKVRGFGAETLSLLMSRGQIGQARSIANVSRVGHGNVRQPQ